MYSYDIIKSFKLAKVFGAIWGLVGQKTLHVFRSKFSFSWRHHLLWLWRHELGKKQQMNCALCLEHTPFWWLLKYQYILWVLHEDRQNQLSVNVKYDNIFLHIKFRVFWWLGSGWDLMWNVSSAKRPFLHCHLTQNCSVQSTGRWFV